MKVLNPIPFIQGNRGRKKEEIYFLFLQFHPSTTFFIKCKEIGKIGKVFA
jgi:hypothetical protein